jgi:hypothetical protein
MRSGSPEGYYWRNLFRWACRPAGKDNASVYLKHVGIGRARLQALRKQQII